LWKAIKRSISATFFILNDAKACLLVEDRILVVEDDVALFGQCEAG